MNIDRDLAAMIKARIATVDVDTAPGLPDTDAGRAAQRAATLLELVRLVFEQVKFGGGSDAERASLAQVVDAAEDHVQRMLQIALEQSGFGPG